MASTSKRTANLKEGMRKECSVLEHVLTRGENDIMNEFANLVKKVTELYDQAGSADMQNLSFETLLQPLLTAQFYSYGDFRWHGSLGSLIVLHRLLSPIKETEFAAAHVERELDKLNAAMMRRRDVYQRLVEYKKTCKLEWEYMKFVDCMIAIGRRNGVELSVQRQASCIHLMNELNSLGIQFRRNGKLDTTSIHLKVEELLGVSEAFIKSLGTNDDGLKKITMNQHTEIEAMCRIPQTRRKVYLAFNSPGGKKNEDIMRKMITMRSECAKMLGFKSWTSYRLATLVAKHPRNVYEFLKKVERRLKPLWVTERRKLLKLKHKECSEYGYEFNDELNMWDVGYYIRQSENELRSDLKYVHAYFPLERVTNGMIDIFAHIFALDFTKLDDLPRWHEDVYGYQINDKESGELMGYIYLDLIERPGKHRRSLMRTLQSGALNENGIKEKTVTLLIFSFDAPTDSIPTLLHPFEIKEYFAEFGRAMYATCSKAKVQMFWGNHAQYDIREAPVAMLKHFVFTRPILNRLSGHYLTGEKIEDRFLEKLKELHKMNKGYHSLCQLLHALFDQIIHSVRGLNPHVLYNDLMQQVMGLVPPQSTFPPGGYDKMMLRQDGRVYHRLYADIYGADMYETVFGKVGPLDSNAGIRFRNIIMETGGTREGMAMLRAFLGREPNEEAFLRSIGAPLVPPREDD